MAALIPKTNILLPIAASVAVVVVGGLAYKAVSSPSPTVVASGGSLRAAPTPSTVDADSPADTIRSLRGQVETLQTSIQEVQTANDTLVDENRQLVKDREELTAEISEQLETAMDQQSAESASRVSGLESAVDTMTTQLQSFSRRVEDRLTQVEQNTEVPVGLGLGSGIGDYPSGTTINGADAASVVWVNPLDVPDVAKAGQKAGTGFVPGFLKTASSSVDSLSAPSSVRSTSATLNSSKPLAREVPAIEPWFTLPDLSAGVDSTSLTSLIGRIYLDDDITNPYPFKIVVGRENLTANFRQLPPEIEGMIFEGYAVGDWPLSCVRGTLNAATFVFEDGSVQSAYPGDIGSRPDEALLNKNTIGYISDPWGNPCISGERITDAPKFLFQRAMLAGAEGYAAALKAEHIDTETYRTSDGTTATLSTFVGDAGEYAAASAYYGAVDETIQWIKERQAQSFDAIYVPSGQRVVFNLQQELRLDKAPDGRKLVHQNGAKRHASLD